MRAAFERAFAHESPEPGGGRHILRATSGVAHWCSVKVVWIPVWIPPRGNDIAGKAAPRTDRACGAVPGSAGILPATGRRPAIVQAGNVDLVICYRQTNVGLVICRRQIDARAPRGSRVQDFGSTARITRVQGVRRFCRHSRECGNDAIDMAVVEAPTSFPRQRE